MDRLTPKGGKADRQIPLQRMGDKGESHRSVVYRIKLKSR